MSKKTRQKRRIIRRYRKQQDFIDLCCDIQGFTGGRGTGKTHVGAEKICTVAKKGWPILCVSPDAGVVTETTLPTFLAVAKSLGVYLSHRLSPYPKVFFKTRDGGRASIVFRSGEKPKKLHGGSYAAIWIDEASLQKEEVFLDVIPSLRHKGLSNLPILLTFTPKGRANWSFKTFFELIDEDELLEINPEIVEWIGDKPYRRKEGTGLVHARSRDNPFLAENYDALMRSNMSSQLAAQELDGNFVDIAGLMFMRHWFEIVQQAPRDAVRVRYWDKAATPGSGCYTAGVLIARDVRGIFYIEDVVRGQWSALERDRWIDDTAKKDAAKYRNEVLIYAEQEGGSAGVEIAQQMVKSLAGFPVFIDNVGGKRSRMVDGIELPGPAKVIRAMPLQAQAEAGNVKIVEGKFNQDWLDEIVSFPESKFADQVDASSGAFNKVCQRSPSDMESAIKMKVKDDPSGRFGAVVALDETRRRAESRRLFDRK